MTRPVTFGNAAATELREGLILLANANGTTTYTLSDQPNHTRGPARYLRTIPGAEAGTGPHTHTVTPPAEGTPCLVITVGGSFSHAWVIPFQ